MVELHNQRYATTEIIIYYGITGHNKKVEIKSKKIKDFMVRISRVYSVISTFL